MEQSFLVELLFAEWPSHVGVCKQDGRVGIESYPLRQRSAICRRSMELVGNVRSGGERAFESRAHSTFDERRVRNTEPSRVL